MNVMGKIVSIAAPINKEIKASKRNFPLSLISLSSDLKDSLAIKIPIITTEINATIKKIVIIVPKSIFTGLVRTPNSKGLLNKKKMKYASKMITKIIRSAHIRFFLSLYFSSIKANPNENKPNGSKGYPKIKYISKGSPTPLTK